MVNQPPNPYTTNSTQPTGNTAVSYPTQNYATQYSGYNTPSDSHPAQTGTMEQTEKQALRTPPSYEDVTNEH
jgi:hypothetical protein